MTRVKEDRGPGYRRELDVAVGAAREAGALLRAEFHRPGGPRGRDGHCPADAEAEAVIRRRLAEAFADHGQRGEELRGQNRPAGEAGRHVWVIDPNDGTGAFLKGHRGSAVSVALLAAGEPVLGVVYAFAAPDDRGDLFTWAKGCGPVTRNGRPVPRTGWAAALDGGHTVMVSQSADHNALANARLCRPARFRAVPSIAYRLALVAAGEGEAGVSLNGPGDWDYAAGDALLRGAGGGALFDGAARRVVYDADSGRSVCRGACCGGSPEVAWRLAGADWAPVLERGGGVKGAEAGKERYGLLWPKAGSAVDDAGLLSRAQGCLLGQLCGDSLGSLVEFRETADIARQYPGGVRLLADGGTWDTIAGQPTDDSELALILARALAARGKFDASEVAGAYGHWYLSYPYDMGGTTRRALGPAAQALRNGADPAAAAFAAANPESAANGALMRVSPLGIFGHAALPEVLAGWARTDARITHPNEVCQDASAVFTVAIARAVSVGGGPKEVYAFAREWATGARLHDDVRQWVRAAADGPPEDYSSKMGWVRIALHNAFFQLLHAPSLEQGVVATVMAGGDTDTNAAIAGALLGAVHGADAVPPQWRDRVLTCRPMAELGARRPRPRDFWPVDALVLAERLVVEGRQAVTGR